MEIQNECRAVTIMFFVNYRIIKVFAFICAFASCAKGLTLHCGFQMTSKSIVHDHIIVTMQLYRMMEI